MAGIRHTKSEPTRGPDTESSGSPAAITGALSHSQTGVAGRYPELIVTAVFAMSWAVVRAATQSITIDEADTYLWWVRPRGALWTANSNNHVLNTLLMWLSTSWFGLSQLSVRLPALLGAALYIAAAVRLCSRMGSGRWLRWILLLCLVFNPFVFDFFVAARGYSLALATLAWAVAIPAGILREPTKLAERRLLRACAASSVCAALSFSANFSFAFADAGILLMIFLWIRAEAARINPAPSLVRLYPRVLAALALPGLVVGTVISGRVALRFPKSQMFFGAKSLGESLRSMVGPSLYQLNPHLFSPHLYALLAPRRHLLLPLLGAAVAFQLILIWRNRSALQSSITRWHLRLASVLAGTLVLALGVHWICFRLFGVLLPLDRTGIYVVFLITLAAGAISAVSVVSNAGRVGHKVLVGILSVMAVYFLLCLRLDHFREWRYDSEAHQAYLVVDQYNRRWGVREIPSYWFYAGSLNFYRVQARNRTIVDFNSIGAFSPYPPERQIYVLYYPEAQAFIEKNRLVVVYHGELSDIVVAVRPGPGVPGATGMSGPQPLRDPLFLTRYRRALQQLPH